MARIPWRQATVRGAALGVVLALGQALLVTALELVENPGGIFRSAEGWRWDFLLETALSWFLPGLLITVPAAVLLTVAVLWLRRGRG